MKLLYVGCRVRILWSESWPELNGTEGTIIAEDGDPEWLMFGEPVSDWIVRPDLWGADYLEDEANTYLFTPSSEQLEPVLPPGLLEEIMSEEVAPEKALVLV